MSVGIWLCLFIIKLYSQKDIFKFIKRKHGKDIHNILLSFGSLKTKFEKTKLDIDYIKLCKQEHLLPPSFATVRLSIQTKNKKLKSHIGRIIMEHELESKHEKKLLRKAI